MIQGRYGRRSQYEITSSEFTEQVQAIPVVEENPENEDEEAGEMGGDDVDMMDDRDSDAMIGGEVRNQIEEYEKNLREAQKAHGIEDSAEEEPNIMKGKWFNNPTAEGDPVLRQKDDEEESPAAGSESHKYLGGFEVDNEEEDME